MEDNKIKDEMVIADMKIACQTSTDSILFNIDSKSDSAGNKGKDDILKVFLKVFNEMQGFSSIPHLADLERELRENDKYEEFKEKFQEKHTLFLEGNFPTTKAEVLALWDRATEILDREWKEVGDFTQPLTIYQMTFSFAQWILYFIENESHHRGQGYTYLRALHIDPPYFWGRESFR